MIDASVPLGLLLDILMSEMKRGESYLGGERSFVALVSEIHGGEGGIDYPRVGIAFLSLLRTVQFI